MKKDQILDALALAISQTTASANAFMSKASTIRTVRDGFAAQAALQSVLLAKLGIAASLMMRWNRSLDIIMRMPETSTHRPV